MAEKLTPNQIWLTKKVQELSEDINWKTKRLEDQVRELRTELTILKQERLQDRHIIEALHLIIKEHVHSVTCHEHSAVFPNIPSLPWVKTESER